MKEKRGNICVYAASSDNLDAAYMNAAYELGKLLATHHWGCVNGAGRSGLMRAVSDGALDAGGEVIGVIPKFMVDNGWCHDRIGNVLITPDMHERKQQMQQTSDAIIALPGGCGTLEELLEAITWRQLGIHSKPIVILNVNGFFDPLIAMLRGCAEEGFMKRSHTSLWTVFENAQDAMRAIDRELSRPTPKPESKL